MPATSVRLVASVGSNSNAPIESDGKLSLNGVQLGLAAVALFVLQTPLLTPPTYRMFASVGCAATVWIAPTTSSLGIMFSTCPNAVGPGPWAIHVPSAAIVTVISVGGACTFPLLSTARLLI